MSVEQIKQELTVLKVVDLQEVAEFLDKLREEAELQELREEVARRFDDKDPSHWLTPEQLRARWDSK